MYYLILAFMRRFTQYIKFIPLFLLGVAVIVWGMVFQRSTKESDGGLFSPNDQGEGPIFPY